MLPLARHSVLRVPRCEWSMAALARKLCEAVENEDAKEVENLLNCGADPNLVLQDGIAAIHLASGKESESALRCLTMILQKGGDPNVRSIEELTPLHVAASWGCCKALIFLLRKGGDINIQDQDGNTALDLALMEKNRRCVVALQEYNERNEEIPNRINDYYKNNSCDSDEISEMSNITRLLESVYEVAPCSSTKISPFIYAPKTGSTERGADYALLSTQLELDLKGRSEKHKHNFAGMENSDLQLRDKITSSTIELKANNSESKCAKDCSNHLNPDITVKNDYAKVVDSKKGNSGESNNSGNQAEEILIQSLNSSSQENLRANRIGKTYANLLLNRSRKFTESQFILEGWEGLDVTSPDHVYTYSRGHSESDMEETLVIPGSDEMTEDEGLVDQDISSSSKYTSCFSDGFSTIMKHSASNEKGLHSDVNCKSLLDSNRNQLNVEDLVAVQERAEDTDNEDLTSTCAQTFNCRSLDLPSQNEVSGGHESGTARTKELLCTSQSPTLPVGDTNESCSQDLRTRLKNLLLSTKGCGLDLEQQDNQSSPSCLRHTGESFCSNTGPLISETNPPIGQNMKEKSSTCLNISVDTLLVESADSEICDLKKILLATKVIRPISPISSEEQSPRFFTDRTRSRLLSSKSRHLNSSLFDGSLEMPQRSRRLRSPDRMTGSPVPSFEVKKSISHTNSCQNEPTLETCVAQNNGYLIQTPKHSGGSASESETTVSISNFLTDDLSSSETEVKSILQVKNPSTDPYIESRVSESMWLTEDASTESSGEAYNKLTELGSDKLGGDFSAASQTGSCFHSTLIEETAGNCKGPRYSFSRLSCVPKADETGIKLTTIPDSIIEQAQLSPGGRPVNVAHFEPVEYLYMDSEKGHALVERHLPCTDQSVGRISDSSDDTIIYDWRNHSSCKQKNNKDSPASTTPSRVAVKLYRLSNDEIARRLRRLGEDPGEVNSKTRKVCILLLDKRLKEQATSGPVGLSFEYSPELSLALRTYDIPNCNNDEAVLSREFDQPDKTRKWREGVLKSSFNYLLLDPRVTRNLPSRCHTLSMPECFRTFVQAVFYVGKGKRARPYCHLYESLTHYKGSNKPPCSKVQHIVDIWRSGQGVLSLHCFQNTIPVEAYTREACMVDAIGLKMLTNQKKGVYYGQAQNWTPTRRRCLGVHMLYRAMQIFLAEGERQLRPPDIRTGS
ncbi:ankyrin repeat and LEM domain-containing protein 1 [Lithobates pipiens]